MGGGTLAVELVRGRGGGVEGDGAAVSAAWGFVLAGEGAGGGGGFGGGGFAEDEEFDEGADEDYDGELAEEESFCEGKTGDGLVGYL